MAPKRSLAFVAIAAMLLNVAVSDMIQSPLRLRLNSDLLKGIFHKKDQDLLKLFDNLSVGEHELSQNTKIQNLVVSLTPKSGNTEEFDYHVSLDMKTFIGIQSNDLLIEGKGQIVHGDGATPEDFTLKGPISDFKLEAEFVTDSGSTNKRLNLKEFSLVIDDSTEIQSTSAAFAEHGHKQELLKWIQLQLASELKQIEQRVLDGDQETISKLPILSLAPVFGLYYATYGAEKVTFADQFVEYDFSPVSLKLVDKLHQEFLKEIDTKFVDDETDASAIQVIVDENLINGVVGKFLKIEKMYSLREFMSMDPRFAVFKQLLTSTTLGMVLPAFKEEYGEGRPLDLVGTASHDFINSGLGGDQSPSGLKIDKNGNFHFQVNLGAQLVVENKQGIQEEARSLYASFQLKGKMFVADPKEDNRTFVILPKGIQLATLKVLKGDQEQFLEQMLIQSMVGFQLDQLKKQLQPVVIPLKKFPNPKELQCLGFNLTNVDIKVNKGYLQLNGNYIKVDKPDDEEICQKLEKSLSASPDAIIKKISSLPGIGSMAGDHLSGLAAKRPNRKTQKEEKPVEELKTDL